MMHPLRWLMPCGFALLFGGQMHSQISFRSAVDLALRNSPKVKGAEASVAKAVAAVSQTVDVYVPAVSVGAGLGQSYGYSPYPPTLFTFSSQSLLYNAAQYSNIRSARAGLRSAKLTLMDVRQAVAEDTAVTFAAVDRDQQREATLRQQSASADRLVAIVQDRLSSGYDTDIDLTTVQLTAAQIRLSLLKAEDETKNDQAHLANLIGTPGVLIRTEGGMPSFSQERGNSGTSAAVTNTAVAAAFENAKAKSQQATGDSKYMYRPQVSLVVQYYRYATFTNSFKQIQALNTRVNIGANNEVFGIQVNLPLYDRLHRSKALESAADAARSLHDAEDLQLSTSEGVGRLRHTIAELQARREVAALEQQLAQQQLDAMLVQIGASSSTSTIQVTPKDEQTSRIAEREKNLAVIDTNYQLRQAEINILRQTGTLEDWIRNAPNASPGTGSIPFAGSTPQQTGTSQSVTPVAP